MEKHTEVLVVERKSRKLEVVGSSPAGAGRKPRAMFSCLRIFFLCGYGSVAVGTIRASVVSFSTFFSMADSLGTLCIASASGASTTVTLIASGTITALAYNGNASVTLPSAAVFVMCRPTQMSSYNVMASTICVVAGGRATAYHSSDGSNYYQAVASLNSSGTLLTLGLLFLSASAGGYNTAWEYNAFA